MISGEIIGAAQHRFSERHVVRLLSFKGHLLASRGDIKRIINVYVPTAIHEEPAQELELVGKISLYDRNIQRPRKGLANALAAFLGVHQGQRQGRVDLLSWTR